MIILVNGELPATLLAPVNSGVGLVLFFRQRYRKLKKKKLDLH